jgi:hypothetical protein
MNHHDWVPATLDWLAFATFLATAAAAWIAAWSVRRADRALLRERRASFELMALAKIAELWGLRPAGATNALAALIVAAGRPNELNTIRHWILAAHDLDPAAAREIEQAVRVRLEERG